jgi:hypothetical protein
VYQSDTEILFPIRVVPSLVELRGNNWRHLVSDVLGEPEASLNQLAFSLLLIRLSGCLTCHTDSYRAMRGCTVCATQVIKRFKGDDKELVSYFNRAKGDIQRYMSVDKGTGQMHDFGFMKGIE